MKVNPIGIQSYQSLENTDRQKAAQQKQTEQTGQDLTIQPKATELKSAVSVKAPDGDYANLMTEKEREAMQVLFARFQNNPRFSGANQNEEQFIGRMLDVRV